MKIGKNKIKHGPNESATVIVLIKVYSKNLWSEQHCSINQLAINVYEKICSVLSNLKKLF